MTVTNGTVEYERVVRPADFESKRAKVSLSFAVEDGSDAAAVTAKVMNMAVVEVHVRLGLPFRPPPEWDKAAEEAKKPARRGAKALPAEVPAATPIQTDAPASGASDGSAKATSDPAAITVADDLATPERLSAAVVITDVDMRKATNEAVANKVTSRAIVDLIEEFTNPPNTDKGERIPGKSMSTIEQDLRAGYLTRLKALYANA